MAARHQPEPDRLRICRVFIDERQHPPYDVPDSAFQGHPRSVGSKGRTLLLGRDTGVPLMFQLKQLRYRAAKHLHLRYRAAKHLHLR